MQNMKILLYSMFMLQVGFVWGVSFFLYLEDRNREAREGFLYGFASLLFGIIMLNS